MEIIETQFAGKKFASILLEDNQTIQDLLYEITLLKGIYGRSTDSNSKQLDDYLKNNDSILGLK